MLNIRPIDGTFYLSGGWIDVPKDARRLNLNFFRAVLDLQFTPDDFTTKSNAFIKDTLSDAGIEYTAIPMYDGDNNNLITIFDVTYNQLHAWKERFKGPRDKILVKCGVGVSRSVAVLINYYCAEERLTFTEAKQRIGNVDKYNYGGLPISIHPDLEHYLHGRYPDLSAFGEKIR